MGRRKNLIPNLLFHRSSKQFYVRINGKIEYLGNDRAQAETKRARIVAKLTGGVPLAAAGGDLLLAEAFAAYEEFATQHYADRRTPDRIRSMIRVTLQVHPNLEAASFGALELEAVQDFLCAEDYSQRYIKHLIGRLKTCFRWLGKKRYVPVSMWDELRTVPALDVGGRETEDVPPVEQRVVDASLPFCRPTLAAMVKLQLLAGMRPGELCRMRRRDISTRPDEALIVPRSRGRRISALAFGGALVWIYIPERHKNTHRGKPRVIGLGPEAQDILAPILAQRQPADYLFRPADDIEDMTPNPMIRPGECYSTRSYGQAVARAVRRANRAGAKLPHWSPGQLRHTAGERIADETDPDKAAAILGHSASRRALDHYIRVTVQTILETAAKVG